MLWIGLTGGIATGKSRVSQILREQGIPVVDADEQAHQAMAPGTVGHNLIIKTFGEEILDSAGGIDRKKLGSIVFSDKSKLSQLEEILHPIVKEMTQNKRRELETQGEEIAFYDVPLLFEKKLDQQFDKVVVVTCDESEQIKRLEERNQLSEEEASLRIANQLPLSEKVSQADFVIENNSSIANLKVNVVEVLKMISAS